MKRTNLFKCGFLSLLFVINSASIHAQVTAIKAGKLLDPETGTITTNQIILVEDQTIKAIGPDVKIPTEHRSSIYQTGQFCPDCSTRIRISA